jgi:hypothetical protein
MTPELAAILGAQAVAPQPVTVGGPYGGMPPGARLGDYYQPGPYAGLPSGAKPQDYYQPIGLGSGSNPIHFLPNTSRQVTPPQQSDPTEFFMELLRRIQSLKPQGQQGMQMPDIGKLMQMIGPIMQQIGPMIRSFQQPQGAPSGVPSAPPDTTSVFE